MATDSEIEALLERADALQEDDLLDQARAVLDDVLDMGSSPALRARAYAARASVRDDQDDLEGAVADYSAALEAVPGDAFVHYMRAIIHHARLDWPASLADLDAAISIDETDPAVFELRAMARYNLQDYVGARSDFAVAIAGNEDIEPRFLVMRGMAALHLATPDAAIEDFTMALDRDASDTKALAQRAKAHEAAGNLRAALADLDTLTELMPPSESLEEHRRRLQVALANVGRA